MEVNNGSKRFSSSYFAKKVNLCKFPTGKTYRTANNEIKTDCSDFEPTECLGLILFKKLQEFQDAVAQIDTVTGESTTCASLLKECVRTALHLKERGVSTSDIVCICSDNNRYSVIPFFAAQFIGARTAALDPSLSLEETTHLLRLTNSRMVFTNRQLKDLIKEGVALAECQSEIVVFGEDSFDSYLKPVKGEDSFVPCVINVHETAIVSFSSGTTGPSKGIYLSHYGLIFQAYSAVTTDTPDVDYLMEKDARLHFPLAILNYTSMYWISGILTIISSTLTGSVRLLATHFDPDNNYRLCQEYKPFLIILSPYYALELVKRGQVHDFSFLTNLLTVGSKIEFGADLKKLFPQTEIYQNYGLTEAGAIQTAFHPDNRRHRELLRQKPQSVGLPEAGVTIRVVDLKTAANASPGQRGELRVKCKTMMNGYLGADSSKQFDSDGWLMTGDVGYYDDDLCFYITDRIKEVFKYRGWFISPMHLEQILLKHPGVAQAAVIGIPCLEGESAMGMVVKKNNCRFDEEELVKFVEEKVPEGRGLTAGVRFIDKMPLTVTGKIKKNDLKKMVRS